MNKYRYLNFRKQILHEKSKFKECKICKGEYNGFIFTPFSEPVECECRKKFIKHKELIIANIPKKRWGKIKLNKEIKAINFLTNEKVDVKKIIINRYVDKFNLFSENGIGLVFFGPSGTGKTTVAIKIIKKLLKKKIDCFYIFFKDLMKYQTNGYENEFFYSLFREIISVNFLVIDELSLIGRVTPHMIAEFTSVCKDRFENQNPTILITNYESLDGIYKNFGMPLSSLVNEAFMPFKFSGNDLREYKYEYMKALFE